MDHLYQIEEVRKQTGADYVVVVMSGDFVQRGEPAIFDKYTRTRMALSAGADLVLELPVSFATASAELFAWGAVSLFNQIGIVDLLCFGSESGSLSDLRATAEILVHEPEKYTQSLRAFLKEGNTFPLAPKPCPACVFRGSECRGISRFSNFRFRIFGYAFCILILFKFKSSDSTLFSQ